MKLIVFEGTDGTGKSTHARYLSEILNYKRYKTALVKAPMEIDEDEVKDMKPWERYEEYLNDMWRVQTKLNRLEGAGIDIAIMDRYTLSLLVYQGGFYVPIENIFGDLAEMNARVPDLTFLFTAKAKDIQTRLMNKDTESFYEADIRQVMEHQTRYKYLWNNYYFGRAINIQTSHDELSRTTHHVVTETLKLLEENS